MQFGWINIVNAFIVVLMLIPNVVYAIKFRDEKNHCKSKLANVLEQLGRYGCMALMVLPLGVWEFGFTSSEAFVAWLAGCFSLLLLYFIFWGLFFKNRKQSYAIVLALAPGFIFLLCGVLLQHWSLVVCAAVFIPAHLYVTLSTD